MYHSRTHTFEKFGFYFFVCEFLHIFSTWAKFACIVVRYFSTNICTQLWYTLQLVHHRNCSVLILLACPTPNIKKTLPLIQHRHT